MATSIYLGMPPANVVKWIKENVETGPSPKTKIWYANDPTKCYEYDWEGDFRTCAAAEGLCGDGISGPPGWLTAPIKIEIGTKITEIGYHSFELCGSLITLIISDSVTHIKGTPMFSSCDNLREIIIGTGIEIIGLDAFDGCNMLTDVIFKGKTIEEVQAMENYPWRIEDTSIIKVA